MSEQAISAEQTADEVVENTTTQSQNISFDDAFKGFADHFQKTGDSSSTGSFKEPEQAVPSSTDDANEEDSSNNIDNVSTGGVPSVEPSPEANSVDYKQLYEKVKRDSDSKMSLVYERLNSVSSQYQQLVEQQSKSGATKGAESKQEMTPALKELYEIYPEVAEAVTQMIEARLSEANANVESAIDRRVAPVQQHLQMSAQQQHLHAIMQEHNDLPAIVESGALLTWVDTLDPVSKAGARNIMYSGSAEEVISLINMYKGVQPSINTASANRVANGAQQRVAAQANANKEEAVVKKVMNALAVSTPKGAAPTTRVDNSSAKPIDFDTAFAALADDYKQNIWNAKRF